MVVTVGVTVGVGVLVGVIVGVGVGVGVVTPQTPPVVKILLDAGVKVLFTLYQIPDP